MRTLVDKRRKIFTPTNIVLYLMFLGPFIYYVVFHYLPMVGVLMAFADYRVSGFKGWVGFKNFQFLFNLLYFWRAFRNTWMYVGMRYAFMFPAPIILALLLNEIRSVWYKKTLQTITALPHFLTWVVIAGIWISMLSPTYGYVNDVIQALGGKPIFFMSKANLFPWIYASISIWKETGYSTIIYLAALAGIDPELYEAAIIDGANKWQQTLKITIPSLRMVILVIFVLSFTGVLNLFEPIFVLSNSMVSSTASVLDTYVYSIGVVQARYSLATAAGLFKSTISVLFVLGANYMSKRFTEDHQGIL